MKVLSVINIINIKKITINLLQMRQTSNPRAWTVLSQVSSKYLLNIIPFRHNVIAHDFIINLS